MISLGMWQADKAALKQARLEQFEQREKDAPISISAAPIDIDTLRYRRVVVHGYYEPEFQILLDNQIYKGQAGYHVITPLHIAGSDMRILVNRGWVPVGDDRSVLPVIESIKNEVEVTGYIQDFSGKYLELSSSDTVQAGWQKVWQNLDATRYKKLVNFPIQSAVLLMDPSNSSGGYVRDWPKPDFRIDVNRGYAIQWYLMSMALLVIYVVTNFKKINPRDKTHE
jgi:surfeit locus 1 family protein